MMNVVRDFFRNFIKYFIYIAVFAQIVSGTVYLVCNFADYIVYPETEEMMHVARGLLFDEYTGIFYPLFIRLCLNIQSLCGFGYYLVVHLFQLIFFGASLYYFVNAFFKGKKACLLAAYVVSFPMCMQCILMVSPFAVRASLGFLMLGAMVRLWQKKWSLRTWCILLISYVLAGINTTDDLYLWLLPVIIVVLVTIFRKESTFSLVKRACLLLSFFLVFVSAIGVMKVSIDAGNRGRMQRTVSSVLFQRTWWPDLEIKYGFLPMEMIEQISRDLAAESDIASEKIIYEIGPCVEMALGRERANELYWEAFLKQLSYNKKAILKDVLGDFTGYVLTPYSAVGYMTGQEGSAFATLYGQMNAKNPKMTYTYFCTAFVSLFALTFGALLQYIKANYKIQKARKKGMGLLISLLIYHALWYSVANVQGVDYRYCLLNVGLIALFIFGCGMFENMKDEPFKKKIKIKRKHMYIGCAVLLCVLLAVGGSMLFKNKYEKSDLLAGKNIVCLGDSIWGLVTDDTGIGARVEDMTGACVKNYAIPGSTASKVSSDDKTEVNPYSLMYIVDALENNEELPFATEETLERVLENADYLIIAYGLNDYFNGVGIESKQYNDISTYKGALNYAVEYFKETYPELEIVLIGQTYCQFYSYGVVERDSDTGNFGGGVGMDYVKAAEEVAEEYQLMFINQYDALPIHKWNGTLYLEDATHLNETGRIEYAKIVSECLLKDFEERNAK